MVVVAKMRLLLLLLLVLLWLPSTASQPRRRRNATTVDSSLCPEGIECATGLPCQRDWIATKASARCCPRTLQCPRGRVVDNHRCVCVPFGCGGGRVNEEEEEELLVIEPRSGQVRCVRLWDQWSDRIQECGGACAHPHQALDLVSCACLVSSCASPKTEQRWRTGEGFFVCVSFF